MSVTGVSVGMTVLFLVVCLDHGLVDVPDRLQAQEMMTARPEISRSTLGTFSCPGKFEGEL